VVCGGTIDAYDIIHDWEYKSDKKIASFVGIGEAIWLTDKRLVIGFKHPSHRTAPQDVYDILKSLLSQHAVKAAIRQMVDNH